MKKRKSISVWIEEKTWCGQFTFSHDDLITAFPEMSAGAIARALTREVANGRIVSPVRGFYVVVPEEYRLRGTVHQSFYIDNLMRHLGRTYYVSLLSAAEIHGAAHQAPMTYYVIIEPPAMRAKKTDRYETHFVCKSHIPTAFVEQRQTRTGYINVSCPELTAVDLISYQDRVGGITRASTIFLSAVCRDWDISWMLSLIIKGSPRLYTTCLYALECIFRPFL